MINTKIGEKNISYDREHFYVDEEKYVKIEEIIWKYELGENKEVYIYIGSEQIDYIKYNCRTKKFSFGKFEDEDINILIDVIHNKEDYITTKYYEKNKKKDYYYNSRESNLSKEDVIEKIQPYLKRKYKNIVVLAGAGASIKCKYFGKTTNEMKKEIAKKLKYDEEIYSEREFFIKTKYHQHYIFNRFNNKYNDSSVLKNFYIDYDLEDFISNMINYEPYIEMGDREKYIKTKQKIFEIIKENTTYHYESSELYHGKFIKKLLEKVENNNNLSIVTTNYDVLFEEAMEEEKIEYIDGFSDNEDKNKFDIKNFEKNNIECVNLLKIHGSLSWRKYYSDIYKDKIENIKNPVIIYPSSNKYSQSYQKPYSELLNKFQELLRNKDSLLITVGFSFQDNHIAKIVIESLKENNELTLLVTDLNINQMHKNWEEIEKLMKNENKNIIFLKATLNDNLLDYL